MITSDKLASLVAEAWPLSLSPLNIMSGFKKTGIYPINPSEVTDRQIAPSKPFQQSPTESSQDGSEDPFFSLDKVELYKKRYEEGYDLDDPSYTAPHAQSVALGMPTARRSGFVVMGVTSGSTKSVQI